MMDRAGVVHSLMHCIETRAKHLHLILGGMVFCLVLFACANPTPTRIPTSQISATSTASATASPVALVGSPCAAPCGLPTFTPNPPGPWGSFAAPTLPAATAIPEPFTGLEVPEEVQAALILGVARTSAFQGRTNLVQLVLYNARTAKASLISIPPTLYVYIPGYTMQRLNVAYPVGGITALEQTIAYNLGVTVDWWAVAHLDDFPQLVDDLGGVDVSVIKPLGLPTAATTATPSALQNCTIKTGAQHLTGEKTLCYVRLLPGDDEVDRFRRQQEVGRALFLRIVSGGTLMRLPELYDKYGTSLQANLGLSDLEGLIPLALKLGDAGRIHYYSLGMTEYTPWELPETQGIVLLPVREQIRAILQDAVAFVMAPMPLSDRVSTLEAELTISPTPTNTPRATPTPTRTSTLVPSVTLTPTHTVTPTGTITPPTATSSLTPTFTATQ
jgi:LCP family protein required for cell wall assembly